MTGTFGTSWFSDSGSGIVFGQTPGWEACCFADSMLRGHFTVCQTAAQTRLLAKSKVGMLSLRKPSADAMRRFLAAQLKLPFTYAAVGATAETPPAGYVVDRTRIRLGEG